MFMSACSSSMHIFEHSVSAFLCLYMFMGLLSWVLEAWIASSSPVGGMGTWHPQHSPVAHPEPHYIIPLLLRCDCLTLKIVEYFHYLLYFSSHIFFCLLQIFHKVGTDVFWCYESRILYYFSQLLVYILNDFCNSLCFILQFDNFVSSLMLLRSSCCELLLYFLHLSNLSHFIY